MRCGSFLVARGWLVAAAVVLSTGGHAADEIHWTITGPTSVTFDWRGSASENAISYGLSAQSYVTTVMALSPTGTCVPMSSAGPFWEARLTGLAPDTVYHYAIAGEPDHTFRTPPAPGAASFRILVEGDVGESGSYSLMPAVQQLMAAELDARFALVVGDLSYADSHGQDAVDQHFNDVMAWSRDVAYMPAWGNHEWEHAGDDLRNYKGRFDFANAQNSPGTPSISNCGEDWYWYDYGGVRFIAYPEPWTGAWADWNTRATALMNAAQGEPSISWIVTFGHRPAYASGHHPGGATLKGYLDALAASHSKYALNLNGHSHDYERSFPQNGSGDNLRGAVHVTVGTGGSSLETDGACLWLTCTQPSWSAARYFHLGYLKLEFTPSSIQGAFVCGPAGGGANDVTCSPGSVLDSFTIVSSSPPPTLYVDKANPECADAGPGSSTQPFCTITQGVNRAVAGNTVVVRSGTYSEYVKVTKSGASTQPIVIQAEPGAQVVVRGQFRGFEIVGRSWITIQGFTVSDTASYGIYASNSSNIVIADNHVTRAGQPVSGLTRYGVTLSNTTDSIVSGNTTDHNSDSGIALVNGTTRVTVTGNVSSFNARGYTRAAPGIDVRSGGNTVTGNICHDNEDSGIQIIGVAGIPSPDNLVVNNVSYRNGDHGIDVSSAGAQRIIGNTVYLNAVSGINLEGTVSLPSSGATIENNICADNAVDSSTTKGNIRVDSASKSGITMDYNLFFLSAPGIMFVWDAVNYNSLATFVAAAGQEPHGLEADPRWMAPSAGDFHLLPASPAIDAADSGASGASSTDLEGRARVDDPSVANTGAGPRTIDDRGAYEHPSCGNGIQEYGEECDGSDVGLAVCAQSGCLDGEPSCSFQCTLDFATCTGCPTCGNGVKEFGEDCDAGDLGGATCENLGQCSLGGGLSCKLDCTFNTANCSCGAICGDGVRQGLEACDGADLGGVSCSNQGCFAGTPTCAGTCALDYASCTNCWAGTLYVDQSNPACSNTGQGTAAAPFCSINAAAAKVVAGGTVIVSSGTYLEYVKVLTSGTPTAPIAFKAAPGATVYVSSQTRGFELVGKSWVTIEGFTVTTTTQYGISVESGSNVTIRGNRVSFAGARSSGLTKPGIYFSATSNSLISGNTVEDNSDSGIYVTSGSTGLTIENNVSARNARGYTLAASGIELRSGGNIVRGNICYNNEVSGIVVQPFGGTTPVPNCLIVNNLTYGNANHGIQVRYSNSSQLVGNTVYANGGSGIDLTGASTQCVVANNIAADNAPNLSGSSWGNIRVETASITGTTLDYDLVFRSQGQTGTMISWAGTAYSSLATFKTATSQEFRGLQGDPLWVAPGTADFRLKLGSPAVDSASSSATGAQAVDLVGTPRTDDPATANTGTGPRLYDDRGAYEYPFDADNDGYASDEDCNDRNPAFNPGVTDDSCDGLDQDCNGQADEDFVPTTTATTCGVGACAAMGVTACVNHVVTETCTPGTPAANDATCNGIDDDCSGQVDEDFVPGPTACGVGACASAGVSSCVNGAVANSCVAGTPTAEVCDGIDNNCNGSVDDGLGTVTCGVGACQNTVPSCVSGSANTCIAGTPMSEVCDGIDNNCDGSVDEGLGTISCGVGACQTTVPACVSGSTNTCTPGAPSAEVCDGIDNNCNGTVDEDFVSAPTTCGIGACQSTGVTVCVNGVVGSTCIPGTPGPEVGCDGIDNDCNPATPDVLDADGDSATCATDCNDSDPSTYPGAPEINDGKDNQCPGGAGYGLIDETSGISGFHSPGVKLKYSWPAQGGAAGYEVARATSPDFTAGCQKAPTTDPEWTGLEVPSVGEIFYYLNRPLAPFTGSWGARSSGVERTGICPAPVDADGDGYPVPQDCDDTNSAINPGMSDANCDGVDQNCSGQADEGFIVTSTNCGVGACAATGQNICANHIPTNTCTPGTPSAEVCDGIDNNCDGSVDEGVCT